MLAPDPISARGARRSPTDADPALRRYLEKEFEGGTTRATLAATAGADARPQGTPEASEAKTTEGFWIGLKRALFRQPRRAHAAGAPGPH